MHIKFNCKARTGDHLNHVSAAFAMVLFSVSTCYNISHDKAALYNRLCLHIFSSFSISMLSDLTGVVSPQARRSLTHHFVPLHFTVSKLTYSWCSPSSTLSSPITEDRQQFAAIPVRGFKYMYMWCGLNCLWSYPVSICLVADIYEQSAVFRQA